MSEYQYYEFRSVDRPLTAQEISKLRAISSRAQISATSFVNEYNYGDFGGDSDALVEKYFDAFVYVANWGTHHFMVRLPKKAFGSRGYAPFCAGDNLRARVKGEYLILSFRADELESDWEEGEGWMDALLPIRADLLRGDLRALYMGWLRAVQNEEVDDDQPEPPLPSGLRRLSPALTSLTEFLDINPDLLEAAGALSADLEDSSPSKAMLSQWISSLPEQDKNAVLFQVASGNDPHAVTGLVRRFDREHLKEASGVLETRRTAGELRAMADQLAKEKKSREEQRLQREQQLQAKTLAAERAKHPDALEKQGGDAWDELDRLIATKKPKAYDTAATLLVDLRDVAARKDASAIFQERLQTLRARHTSKPSFLRKLSDAGL